MNVFFSRDTGYGWLLVILEVFRLAPSPKIVIDHEFLAGCDEDYLQITEGLTPQFWYDYLLLLDPEIVQSNCPEYAKKYRYGHYSYMVLNIYAVMAGLIRCSDHQIFQEYGKRLPFHDSYFRNPFVFIQWISLRLGIPTSLIVYQMSEYPGRIKCDLFQAWKKLCLLGNDIQASSGRKK